MEAATEAPPTPETPRPAGLPDDELRGPVRATSARDLKDRALHKDVVLPSGAIVDIRLPNLPLMVKSGSIPNKLVDAALEQRQAESITKEMIEESWDYTEFIIPKILVSPEISEDDVRDLDTADIELLLALSARHTDMDAIGRQLGGLETQASFREFRAEQDLRAALGGR